MIDIHCHILPGIDDGARSMAEAVEMARIAAGDGIRAIIATPHIADSGTPKEKILLAVSVLNRRLEKEMIPVTVFPGAEVTVGALSCDPHPHTLHQSNHILVEFPHTHMLREARQILFDLTLAGFVPIIAHPERNPSVIRNPIRLLELLDMRVKVQITAGSLTGCFGSDAKACARYLLKKNAVAFLATDAHSAATRPPLLSQGLSVAENVMGREAAQKLVCDNPGRIVPIPNRAAVHSLSHAASPHCPTTRQAK